MVGCVTSTNPDGISLLAGGIRSPSQNSGIEEHLQPTIIIPDLERCYVCGQQPTHMATNKAGRVVAFCSKCVRPSVGLPCLFGIKRICARGKTQKDKAKKPKFTPATPPPSEAEIFRRIAELRQEKQEEDALR